MGERMKKSDEGVKDSGEGMNRCRGGRGVKGAEERKVYSPLLSRWWWPRANQKREIAKKIAPPKRTAFSVTIQGTTTEGGWKWTTLVPSIIPFDYRFIVQYTGVISRTASFNRAIVAWNNNGAQRRTEHKESLHEFEICVKMFVSTVHQFSNQPCYNQWPRKCSESVHELFGICSKTSHENFLKLFMKLFWNCSLTIQKYSLPFQNVFIFRTVHELSTNCS